MKLSERSVRRTILMLTLFILGFFILPLLQLGQLTAGSRTYPFDRSNFSAITTLLSLFKNRSFLCCRPMSFQHQPTSIITSSCISSEILLNIRSI